MCSIRDMNIKKKKINQVREIQDKFTIASRFNEVAEANTRARACDLLNNSLSQLYFISRHCAVNITVYYEIQKCV